MLELILDGECHNGHRSERLGEWHWRLQARGDDPNYCYYFQFTLRGSATGTAVVDVAPDADLLPESAESFRRHRPQSVWLLRRHDWERHPLAEDAPPDCLRIRLPLVEGEAISVSRMRPYPFSAVLKRLEEMASQPGARSFSLGHSSARREIPALEIGTGEAQLLVLAGQHPAEFGGIHALLGIGDWLLSSLPEAHEIRGRYRVTLVPVLNPDGNVGGRCGHNEQRVDLYRAFTGAAQGTRPNPPEAACVWDWIRQHGPRLTLNFHSFTQPSPAGVFPWEGMYAAPADAFIDPVARDRQSLLNEWLAWETDGFSQHGRFSFHIPAALEYQLAALGVPTVFYETQDVVGPFRQRRSGVQVLRTALRVLEA